MKRANELFFVSRHSIKGFMIKMSPKQFPSGMWWLCEVWGSWSRHISNYPENWRWLKKARVTPIFKNKGSNTDSNNYSTQTSLHHVIDSFLDNIIHGKFTGVYLFDLAKCFDTIDHELLLYKLGKYGLTETELLWFSNYLSERSQIVNINGQLSSHKLIKTGVPQGSVLGPLLFLLFINDFPSCHSNATCNIFADDNMVYVNSTSIAEVERYYKKCWWICEIA